jgi:two-component system copper resistance phosphate regulon response regulator CusR
MRILVIEDEPRMLDLLRKGLQERDCAVMTAMDGDTGLEIATTYEFDAILLDIGLPRRDGFELMQALRERSCPTRVLMLTARDGEDNIIRGLDLGADDYVTKPFSFPELVARLQSITRPRRDEGNARIEAGDLVVDLIRRSVTRDSVGIDLTRSEFSLLVSLIRSAGRCVSRRSLMQGVWGSDPEVGQGALDVLVNSLRSKIDVPYRQKLIHTVRGSGYILDCTAREMERAR